MLPFCSMCKCVLTQHIPATCPTDCVCCLHSCSCVCSTSYTTEHTYMQNPRTTLLQAVPVVPTSEDAQRAGAHLAHERCIWLPVSFPRRTLAWTLARPTLPVVLGGFLRIISPNKYKLPKALRDLRVRSLENLRGSFIDKCPQLQSPTTASPLPLQLALQPCVRV